MVAKGFPKYTDKYGLSVWTSSKVMHYSRDDNKHIWTSEISTKNSTGQTKHGPSVPATLQSQQEYTKLFEDLEEQGFKVDREAGMYDQIVTRYGGYYIEVGTSEYIANSQIKVKSGVPLRKLTEKGELFEDGEELRADLVVAATGYERGCRKQAAEIVGEEIASGLPEFWD